MALSARRRLRQACAITAAVSAMTLGAACSNPTTTTAADDSSAAASAAPTTSFRVAGDECTQTPPTGAIDRGAHDLNFPTGAIHIAVNSVSPQEIPAPAAPSPIVDDADCYRFEKWGNPAPDVPPDSLMFLFKGSPATGAQIEFFVGDLTGGVLPPIGDVRPRVGPLTGPITANIGVSTDGTWYQATRCALHLTAMSSARGAGWFTCPATTASTTNPFDPSDDVPYDADAPSATTATTAAPGAPAPATSTPTAAPGVIITGWFDVAPR